MSQLLVSCSGADPTTRWARCTRLRRRGTLALMREKWLASQLKGKLRGRRLQEVLYMHVVQGVTREK